jgi:hypothetical protein
MDRLGWRSRVRAFGEGVSDGSSRQVLYQVLMYPSRTAAGVVSRVFSTVQYSVVVRVPVACLQQQRQCAASQPASLGVSGCARQMCPTCLLLRASRVRINVRERDLTGAIALCPGPIHTFNVNLPALCLDCESLSCLHASLALAPPYPDPLALSSTLEPRRLLLLLRRPMMIRPP